MNDSTPLRGQALPTSGQARELAARELAAKIRETSLEGLWSAEEVDGFAIPHIIEAFESVESSTAQACRELSGEWRKRAKLLKEGLHEDPRFLPYADKLEMCADELDRSLAGGREAVERREAEIRLEVYKALANHNGELRDYIKLCIAALSKEAGRA